MKLSVIENAYGEIQPLTVEILILCWWFGSIGESQFSGIYEHIWMWNTAIFNNNFMRFAAKSS